MLINGILLGVIFAILYYFDQRISKYIDKSNDKLYSTASIDYDNGDEGEDEIPNNDSINTFTNKNIIYNNDIGSTLQKEFCKVIYTSHDYNLNFISDKWQIECIQHNSYNGKLYFYNVPDDILSQCYDIFYKNEGIYWGVKSNYSGNIIIENGQKGNIVLYNCLLAGIELKEDTDIYNKVTFIFDYCIFNLKSNQTNK